MRRASDVERMLRADLAEAGVEAAVERIVASVVTASEPDVDGRELSRVAIRRLGPELQRRTTAQFGRRVAAVLVPALLPLPFVWLIAGYALLSLHSLISTAVSPTLATYVVANYAAGAILLVAATYAAVPLLVARRERLWARAGGRS